MSTERNKVFDEALSLPADARIDLVERLLSSLNLPTQSEIDRVWATEAERRVAELERGEVEPVQGSEVFDEIRRKYDR